MTKPSTTDDSNESQTILAKVAENPIVTRVSNFPPIAWALKKILLLPINYRDIIAQIEIYQPLERTILADYTRCRLFD